MSAHVMNIICFQHAICIASHRMHSCKDGVMEDMPDHEERASKSLDFSSDCEESPGPEAWVIFSQAFLYNCLNKSANFEVGELADVFSAAQPF